MWISSPTKLEDFSRSERLYLIRKDLLQNPRFGTPWQRLYSAKDIEHLLPRWVMIQIRSTISLRALDIFGSFGKPIRSPEVMLLLTQRFASMHDLLMLQGHSVSFCTVCVKKQQSAPETLSAHHKQV